MSGQDSRLSVITRNECPFHGSDTGTTFSERGSLRCGYGGFPLCGEKLVEVVYVPEGRLAGAVEERDRYREALKQINAYERPFEPWELRRIARDALLHGVGGQSS